MKREKYNGWTNYETWLVNLWMDNDQISQGYFAEMADEALDAATPTGSWTREESARFVLADKLKDHFENEYGGLVGPSGMWSDLLGAALSEVNWDEIASHLMDEAVERKKEEDKEWKDYAADKTAE